MGKRRRETVEVDGELAAHALDEEATPALLADVDGSEPTGLGSFEIPPDDAPAEVAALAGRQASGTRCRQALLELVRAPGKVAVETEAAQAVLEVADSGDGAFLRQILDINPDAGDVVWSVACYELGSVTPASVQEFDDPVAACLFLRACDDAEHAAAELIASSGGVQWAAMTRTLRKLRMQLASADTCQGPTASAPDLVAGLRGRWDARIKAWLPDHVTKGDREASERPVDPGRDDPAKGRAPSPSQVMTNAVRSALAEALPHIEEGVAAALASCENLTHTIADGVVDRVRGDLGDLDDARRNVRSALDGLADIERLADGGDGALVATVRRVRRQLEGVLVALKGNSDPDVNPLA